MRSLRQFQAYGNQKLFANAERLPTFFETNLVDPCRVVKAFYNDPQANIRIFYYQYLKLCFELETVNFEHYIQKIEELINNPQFKFMFQEQDDSSIFNDLQFKRLISQFFGVLGDGTKKVEEAIDLFPIMDTIFIYFFRSILILFGKTDSINSYIHRDDLLDFLGAEFGVDISSHDKCIKYVQTDIFVLEEDPREVYMAYMDYGDQNDEISYDETQSSYEFPQTNHQINHYVNSGSNYSQNPISSGSVGQATHLSQPANLFDKKEKVPFINQSAEIVPKQESRTNNHINHSYIASQFIDYTDANINKSNGLDSLVKNGNLMESGNLEDKKNFNRNSKPQVKVSFETKEDHTQPRAISPINQKLNDQKPNLQRQYKVTFQNYQSDQESTSQLQKKGYQMNKIINNDKLGTNISIDLPTSKKFGATQQMSIVIENDWLPTKDFGYFAKNSNYQYIPEADYQKSSANYDNYSSKYQIKPDLKKPISYNPIKQQIPVYNQYKKPTSYDPFKLNSNPNLVIGKSPFGLNVSQQFTNSFTMKAMTEPFRTNVHTIRSRARNYRNSLRQYIK